MKKIHAIAMMVIITLSGLGASYAEDMPTRVLDEGTRITLTVGSIKIPAILNETTASKDLISRLPYSVTLRRYVHDFCGVMPEPLQYDEKDVQNGWLNGDLSFARDGNYFVIFYGDEEKSEVYGHQVILGKVNVPLSTIKGLGAGSIDVHIALAE